MKATYTYAIVGGTFDRLHLGHQRLIDAACEQAEKVHIGITTEKFYQHKTLAQIIEPFETRVHAVKEYVKQKNYSHKVTIVELKDLYGESLTEKNIDAIFVTEDTQHNAELMNQKRAEHNFPPMKIELVPLVKAEDRHPITSERIRRGEINRKGQVYLNLFQTNLLLPETLREELRKPIGNILTTLSDTSLSSPRRGGQRSPLARQGGGESSSTLITVGDIVTLSALDAGLHPALSIIDFKTQRTNLDEAEMRKKITITEETHKNQPGTINQETVQAIQEKLQTYLQTNEPQTIVIAGEEDLLALPAILLAPLNATVLYGQFDQGAVVVEVTEDMKDKVKSIVEVFDKYIYNPSHD